MKINRYKRVQRYITFYRNNFNFHPPYQVLLDATFCHAALKNKVNIADQMPKYLAEQVKLLTTVCVVNETEKLSKVLYGAMIVVKQFPVHKCGHEKNPITAAECLLSLLRKSANDHYFLATQDPELTKNVRQLAYVPLLYMKMNTIVMEKPQDMAKDIAEQAQEQALQTDDQQLQTLKTLKRIAKIEDEDDTSNRKRKRKGPKGPNPLSCKKKQKKSSDIATSNVNKNNSSTSDKMDTKKRRKRRHKMPNHIKRMLNKIETELAPSTSAS